MAIGDDDYVPNGDVVAVIEQMRRAQEIAKWITENRQEWAPLVEGRCSCPDRKLLAAVYFLVDLQEYWLWCVGETFTRGQVRKGLVDNGKVVDENTLSRERLSPNAFHLSDPRAIFEHYGTDGAPDVTELKKYDPQGAYYSTCNSCNHASRVPLGLMHWLTGLALTGTVGRPVVQHLVRRGA
jgi:hypothetical protein